MGGGGKSSTQWVEIIEPRSREKMFVNLTTGECGWDEPTGVTVRRLKDHEGHQWWELFDVQTSRFYYYNSTTQQTCWQKPKSPSAIIIPLAKFQLIKSSSTNGHSSSSSSPGHHHHPQENKKEVACQTRMSCTILVNNSTQTTPPPSLRRNMIRDGHETWSTKRSLRSYLLNEARHAKGLQDLPAEEDVPSDYDDDDLWESDGDGIDGSSTSEWDADDEHDGDGHDDDLDDEDDEVVEEVRTPSRDLIEDSEDYETEDDVDGRLGHRPMESPTEVTDDHSPTNHSSMGEYVDTSFVFVPNESTTTWTRPTESDSVRRRSRNGDIEPSEARSDKVVSSAVESIKKPPRGPPSYVPSPPRLPWATDRRPQPPPHQKTPPPPAPAPPSIPPVPPERNYSLNSNSIPRNSSTQPPATSLRQSLPRPPDPPFVDIPPPPERKPLKEDKKSSSAKKDKKRSSGGQEQVMEKFARENVVRHIKRGVGNQLLKRKTSLKAMLTWSKNSIKQPMIATLSTSAMAKSEIRAEAIATFKLIQQFMGDRLTAEKDGPTGLHREVIAFDVVTMACQRHELRDEVYVQLCRQTTDNPKKSSLLAGFQLMACCLMYFPPSIKFSPYLASFLANCPLKEAEITCREDEDIVSMVEHCYRLLFKVRGIHLAEGSTMSSSGTIYCRKPVTPKELDMVLEAIDRRFTGIFGESLDSLMKGQGRRWPNRKLPWILTTLCEAILRMGGAGIEGIFRIAADTDELSFIKLVIDCINFDLLDDDGDILELLNHNSDEPVDVHVFACLLKQWFRSLKEPIVPYDLYEECLEASSSRRSATAIVEKLPKDNKLVLGYLIRFLQVFSAPENANETKMDDSNLSMIWAPNILRSTQSMLNPLSLHPSVIFENTRKEMTFIRTLIQSLDTTFIQGVY